MGRVSREQAERNRERVLETACRLFRKHGVEGVSIGDIMKEAGLTAGAFYKQFVSKEALIDEAPDLLLPSLPNPGSVSTSAMNRTPCKGFKP
ncbi:TetR family transcriptional regulator [Alcaligenes sp. HPC1271]|nr:TetR/AcrR family transcriptional regulator [Alcaligenes sp. HPC1271]EKU30878.1 TetR family transcriptional regulator [Alcaligenes sp. HPC1271]